MGSYADELASMAADVMAGLSDQTVTIRRGPGQPGTVSFATGVAATPTLSEFTIAAMTQPVNVGGMKGQGSDGGRAKVDEVIFTVLAGDCEFEPREGDLVIAAIKTPGGGSANVTRRICMPVEREVVGNMLKLTCRTEHR